MGRCVRGMALLLCSASLLLRAPSSRAQQQERPASVYRITGTVVSERDGSPVARCRLTAGLGGAAAGPRQQRFGDQPTTFTDASGRFSLELPSAGAWRVTAAAPGFRPQAFEHHQNFFTSVVLTQAAPTHEVVFRAEPDSTVTGYVLDEAGEPVRHARVLLYAVRAEGEEFARGDGPQRSGATTDDLGHYELSAVAPGEYRLAVQAEPWYATATRGVRPGGAPDPVFDVVYPMTWFPGSFEKETAEVLALHGGDVREADFRMVPVPATHLRMAVPAPAPEAPAAVPVISRRGPGFPTIERVSNDGQNFNHTSYVDPSGQVDIGGLAPGLYRVVLERPGEPSATPQFLRVTGGGVHTVDLSSAVPAASVTLQFEGETETGRLQVILTDVDTGLVFRGFPEGGLRRRGEQAGASGSATERTLQVPPGRYRVTLAGGGDLSIASVAVKGVTVPGRVVTVASGPNAIALRLVHGRAAVQGVAMRDKSPVSGAMVLLVPASYGDAGGIDVVRRDQTNTDGSFSIEDVLPGQYILAVIDHGWDVNWRDPATMQRFLLRGVPLELNGRSNVKQVVEAQSP